MRRFHTILFILLTTLTFVSIAIDQCEKEFFQTHTSGHQTIIVGDSRAMAIQLKHGKTIAIPGQPIALSKHYINQILYTNKFSPPTILMNVTPGDFHFGKSDKRLYLNQDNWFSSNKVRIAKATGTKAILDSDFSILKKFDIILSNISLFNLHQLKLNGTGGKYYQNSKFDVLTFNPTKSLESVHLGSSLSKNTLHDLHEIYEHCAKNKVNLVLFQTPFTHHFHDIIPEQLMLEHDSILQNFNRLPYCTVFRDLPNKRGFSLNEFYDCTHLNEQGGKKFSQLLQDEIDILLSTQNRINLSASEVISLHRP